MKKYFQNAGFTYGRNRDDLTNRQFYLGDVGYSNSDYSTMGNLRLERLEEWFIFVRDFDPSEMQTKIESILNDALSNGVNISFSNTIEAVREENGYLIRLELLIKE